MRLAILDTESRECNRCYAKVVKGYFVFVFVPVPPKQTGCQLGVSGGVFTDGPVVAAAAIEVEALLIKRILEGCRPNQPAQVIAPV